MRGKDCAGEVQIVERTLSIKEATRDFPKNQSFVVCTRREEGEGSRGMEGAAAIGRVGDDSRLREQRGCGRIKGIREGPGYRKDGEKWR